MITAAFTMLAVSAVGFLIRALRGPALVDRVVAVDALVIVAIAAVAVDSVRRDSARFVDAAVLLGLIAFVGTGITARFIERRGS